MSVWQESESPLAGSVDLNGILISSSRNEDAENKCVVPEAKMNARFGGGAVSASVGEGGSKVASQGFGDCAVNSAVSSTKELVVIPTIVECSII